MSKVGKPKEELTSWLRHALIGCCGLMVGISLLSLDFLPCIRTVYYRDVGHAMCTRYNSWLGYPGLRRTFYKRTGGVLKFACLRLG